MMKFTKEEWNRNAERYQTILDMPFNQELCGGTLPQQTFKYYMIQDAHYLEGFARALAVEAAKDITTDHIIQFSSLAHTAIVVERSLHQEYFDKFGVSRESFRLTEPSPECELYTSYLTKLAYQAPYEVLIAGLLPCFWIYAEVGKHIHQRAAENNPYQEWIKTYASEEFEAGVQRVIDVTNSIAAKTTQATREEMHLAFKRATQLEWMFWDSAYHQRTLPL
jgi:thiaminase/transcriptional activator TenA